jgi:exoribonuclease R
MRRYTDLVSIRQLTHYLKSNGILYGKEELRKLTYIAEEWLRKGKKLEQVRRRYWLMKYLSKLKGRNFEAVVLDRFGQDILVELVDYPLRFILRPRYGANPGDAIQLKLQGIDMRRGLPHFEEAI